MILFLNLAHLLCHYHALITEVCNLQYFHRFFSLCSKLCRLSDELLTHVRVGQEVVGTKKIKPRNKEDKIKIGFYERNHYLLHLK